MATGTVRTAVRQHTKGPGSHTANYTSDGVQAYYLHRAGSEETWFTDGASAINHWEEAGGELYVGRSPTAMQKIR